MDDLRNTDSGGSRLRRPPLRRDDYSRVRIEERPARTEERHSSTRHLNRQPYDIRHWRRNVSDIRPAQSSRNTPRHNSQENRRRTWHYESRSAEHEQRLRHRSPRVLLRRVLPTEESGRSQINRMPIQKDEMRMVRALGNETRMRNEKRDRQARHNPKLLREYEQHPRHRTSISRDQPVREIRSRNVDRMSQQKDETPFDSDRIEQILKLSNKEKIVQLNEDCIEFERLLLRDHDKEFIVLLLRLFSDLRSDGPRQPTQTVVSAILNSNIHRQLIDFVQTFADKSDDERRHLPIHLKNCLKMIKTLLAVVPELALGKISTIYTIVKEAAGNIAGFGMDGETLLLEVEKKIKDATEKLKQDRERKARMKPMSDLHNEQPPDDIKEISVFPQPSDIVRDTSPYLRTNLIDQPYRSSKHYLDVQFRLLREDFIRPLRDGITEIRSNQKRGETSKRRYENVKVYEHVRFLFAKPGISGVEHKIQFDVTKFRRVRWQNTKRLLTGNLLCLSSDNFEKDIVFAIVTERREEELCKGRLQVHLIVDEEKRTIHDEADDEPLPEELLTTENRIYTMVESEAYYESYRHTLDGMKEMDEIPLKRYIVRRETDAHNPRYLKQEHTIHYDFRPLVTARADQEFDSEPPKKIKRDEVSTVAILSNDWPPHEMFGLNRSQAHALRLSLTHEFAVIQGPPGTGKTHVGLAIMKILLHNKTKWKRNIVGCCPILVVCYTNHALDQFLEGIATFTKSSHSSIVRLGGRCKSETVKKYCISEVRKSRTRVLARDEKVEFGSIRARMEKIQELYQTYEHSANTILSFKILQECIPRHLLEEFSENVTTMSQWLEIESKSDRDRAPQTLRKPLKNSVDKSENHCLIYGEAAIHEEQRYVEADDQQIMEDKQTLKQQRERKRYISSKLSETSTMHYEEESFINDVFSLKTEDRWRLYRTWVERWKQWIKSIISKTTREYEDLTRRKEAMRKQEDAFILKNADVVAATTTGAAKYRDLISGLDTQIVIVEEAAEVLEAHIVTSMPKTTEHLILIGDHRQLRPSPTSNDLTKHYNLDVSLFERLIKLKNFPHATLDCQHRMRPSIADLIRPHIYENLDDHESVKQYGDVLGIEKPVFFLRHNNTEDHVQDGKSQKNKFEADFLAALCDYIIKQGYKPSQITILTMYSGQVFQFRDSMKRQPQFQGVKVTTVDNFQGEENDFILLSLVRSNKKKSIGFVRIDNRICVALSRAKRALYCVGDMQFLAENSRTWAQVVRKLEKSGNIGDYLMLKCVHHAHEITPVKCAEDFQRVPDGGCRTPCQARLDCGHACERFCHPEDHEYQRCRKPCERIVECEERHKCSKECWEECEPCVAKVLKKLPKCGHDKEMECHMSPEHEKCTVKINQVLPCGDDLEVHCFEIDNLSTLMCKEKCDALLECQHRCRGSCNECFQGRLHIPCRQKCGRTLICEHECKSFCSSCPPCRGICKTKCVHSHCEKKCGYPCVLCTEECAWSCPHFKCTKLCSEPCDRPPCNEPCPKKLKDCSHPCIGLCGEPCPNLCRVCNKDEVTEIFFGDEDEEDARFIQLEDCKHIFTFESLDRWMEQEEDGNAIKMKECPKCKTTIWKSVRYGNIINKLLNKVNRVKSKTWGDMKEMKSVRRKLALEIDKCFRRMPYNVHEIMSRICGRLRGKAELAQHEILILEERIRRLEKYGDLLVAVEELPPDSNCSSQGQCEKDNKSYLLDDMNIILRWINYTRTTSTEQEQMCFSREMKRIKDAVEFINMVAKYRSRPEVSGGVESPNEELKNMFERLTRKLIHSRKPYTDQRSEKVKLIFSNIYKNASYLHRPSMTVEEKAMICSAMGFAGKGHWYACPNGHVYAIGECGGATEKSKCPECEEEIGGSRHQLVSTNRVATEMDGATRPAYDPLNNVIPQELLNDLRRQGFQ